MDDNTWLAVRALLIAAKELQERDRFLDTQEHNILWDVREMISEVVNDDLLFRVRSRNGGNPETPSVAVDVHQTPEAGRGGVRQPNLAGRKPPAVSLLPPRKRRGLSDLQAKG